MLLLCQHHLSPLNSLPVLRGCMTEINQRAIAHTRPLMCQPIDTGIRRGMVRERCVGRGGEEGEKCRRQIEKEIKGEGRETLHPNMNAVHVYQLIQTLSRKSSRVCTTTNYSICCSLSLFLKLIILFPRITEQNEVNIGVCLDSPRDILGTKELDQAARVV